MLDSVVGLARVTSPIERQLAEAFTEVSKWTPRREWDHEYELGRWEGWFMVVLAQPCFTPYRPDFVIASCFPGDELEWMVLVEADGHDYHERTKAQARHDKARDRFFTTRGGTVLRYTGSEIHADPYDCAAEAFACAMRLQSPNLMKHFEAWLDSGGKITADEIETAVRAEGQMRAQGAPT